MASAVAVAAAELERACSGNVAKATAADSVLGVQPEVVARPGSTGEVAALMRVATAHDLAVVVRGAGTKIGWGTRPERCDVLLETTRVDALVEHAAGDLVVVAGAGRRLEQLQRDVGSADQRLGIDPARSGTVGGAVATGVSGPLRLRHGAVRDLVIGMTLVRPDGVVAHSGGKVVKNVAGYDLAKLLTGSYGTLGVITQVAFRLHPVPTARVWAACSVGSVDEAHRAVQALVHSQLAPAAVELDWSSGAGVVAAEFEGHVDGARACAVDAAALLGGDAATQDAPPQWWGREPDGAVLTCTVTHEIGRVPALLSAVADATDRTHTQAVLRGSVGVGTVCVAVRADDAVAAIDAVTRLRAASGRFGGWVVVRDLPGVPDEVRAGLDVWGPVRGLDLMRAVKQRFDPARLLAPGRFVGGI